MTGGDVPPGLVAWKRSVRHLVEPVIGTVDVPSRSLVKTPFKIRPMVTVFEEGPIIKYHNQYFNCKENDKIT